MGWADLVSGAAHWLEELVDEHIEVLDVPFLGGHRRSSDLSKMEDTGGRNESALLLGLEQLSADLRCSENNRLSNVCVRSGRPSLSLSHRA